jgi:hypothetical protein
VQRVFTIVGFVILFAVGVASLAGGAATGGGSYIIPEDPVMAVILLGSIAGIVVITFAAGVGLAQGFRILSNQVSARYSEEDRPEIEKRALALVDKAGSAAGNALSKVGYGGSTPAAPYTPGYSYKAQPENAETRQFVNGIVVVLVLLFGYAALTHWDAWSESAQALFTQTIEVPGGQEIPLWAIPAGAIAVILGGPIALGAGLAFWFRGTHQEMDKAANKPRT